MQPGAYCRRFASRYASPALIVVAAVAVFTAALTPVAFADDEPVVTAAWAPATPPNARTAALYLTISNPGSDDEILSARSDAAATVELHTHEQADGMMRMRRLDKVALAAGTTLQFQPRGLHVMLIDLERGLVAGDVVSVVLTLRDAGDVDFDAVVRDLRP